jgi:hypothetical protein
MLAVLDSALRTTLGLADSDPALSEVLAATGTKLPPVWRTTALTRLSADAAQAGDREAALRYALEASEIRAAAPARLIFFDFERRHETELILGSGEERLAREDVRRLGEGVGRNRRFRLVHLRMLAVLNGWDGDPDAALSALQEAEVLAQEMGLPGELWRIRADSGELHEECGDEARAEDAFCRAARTMRSLADRIDATELRESFLATPQARRVMER